MNLLNQSCNPDLAPLHVDLALCVEACGSRWNYYNFWDIQKRLASWVVPLFILIGLKQFAPFRSWNTAAVVLHLLSDPIGSTANLLWKLQNTRDYYAECQALPTDLQKSAAIILSAYEEWENVWYAKYTNGSSPPVSRTKDRVADFIQWLGVDREARSEASHQAAIDLILWRARGFWGTCLGILGYVVTITLAFVKVGTGDYTNRTGHSIAFGMLHSWLIPAVLLASLVGTYHRKSSTRWALLRMLEKASMVRTGSVADTASDGMSNSSSSENTQLAAEIKAGSFDHKTQEVNLELPRFPQHLWHGSVDYRLLEWCGGNPTFSPQQFSHGTSREILSMIAIIPFVLSILSAVFISYFNPTRGIGCRIVHQLSFFASWLLSALLT